MASLSHSRGHGKTWARLFLFLGIAFLIAACSPKNFAALRPGIEKRGHYIEGVPFYQQTESTCGPAALAGILAFWGRPVNLEEISSKLYLRELRGTLPMDIDAYARKAGFQSDSSSGTLDQLKQTIKEGTPVICLLDLGFSLYRKPHYVLATGYDDENRAIIMHDGLKPDRVIGYDAFNKAWNRAGRWMIVITPESAGEKHGQ